MALDLTFGIEIETHVAFKRSAVPEPPVHSGPSVRSEPPVQSETPADPWDEGRFLFQLLQQRFREHGLDCNKTDGVCTKNSDSYSAWKLTSDATVTTRGGDRALLQRQYPELIPKEAPDDIEEWEYEGVEIVSRPMPVPSIDSNPCTQSKWEEAKRYYDALCALKSANPRFLPYQSPACGLHIHIGRADNSMPPFALVKHLSILVLLYEEVISTLHPPHRTPYGATMAAQWARSNRGGLRKSRHMCRDAEAMPASEIKRRVKLCKNILQLAYLMGSDGPLNDNLGPIDSPEDPSPHNEPSGLDPNSTGVDEASGWATSDTGDNEASGLDANNTSVNEASGWATSDTGGNEASGWATSDTGGNEASGLDANSTGGNEASGWPTSQTSGNDDGETATTFLGANGATHTEDGRSWDAINEADRRRARKEPNTDMAGARRNGVKPSAGAGAQAGEAGTACDDEDYLNGLYKYNIVRYSLLGENAKPDAQGARTLEFRQPTGTLDHEEAAYTVQLYTALMRVAERRMVLDAEDKGEEEDEEVGTFEGLMKVLRLPADVQEYWATRRDNMRLLQQEEESKTDVKYMQCGACVAEAMAQKPNTDEEPGTNEVVEEEGAEAYPNSW